MGNKLYVGNLVFSATEQSLTQQFSEFGTVNSAKIITDRDTGRSKGFGFVEMSNDDEANAAIEALDGHEVDGRKIVVNIAKPMEPRSNNNNRAGGNRNNRW